MAILFCDESKIPCLPFYFTFRQILTVQSISDYFFNEVSSKKRRFFAGSQIPNKLLVKGAPPSVLLLRMGNLSNKELLVQFERHLPQVQALFEDGAGLVEFYEGNLVRF